MLIRRAADLKWSDVTPHQLDLKRREFLQTAAVPVLAAAGGAFTTPAAAAAQGGEKLAFKKSALSTTGEDLTPFQDVTHYNNFYEFGVDKDSPAVNAKSLRTRPWTVKVDGAVAKGGTLGIDDLIKRADAALRSKKKDDEEASAA